METVASLSSEPEPEPEKFSLEVSIQLIINIANAYYRQRILLSKF